MDKEYLVSQHAIDPSIPIVPRVYVHGHAWGPWLLDVDRQCLCWMHDGGIDPARNAYEIDLDEITGPFWLIDWLCQINDKSWATAEVMGHLSKALLDLFSPRSTMDPHRPARAPQAELALRLDAGRLR